MSTIVVASDDLALRELLLLLLEDLGYGVQAATDAPSTLEAVEEADQPLLVVLDLALANKRALDVLRVVGSDPALCYRHAYLLLAPHDQMLPCDVWPMLEALALPVLTKPLDLDEFFEMVGVLALSMRAAPADADPLGL